ncbi:hypothetical protein M569_07627, partial [Genlisea aurea]
FGDVLKHNRKEDCWLIIAGKVYNVTPFLEEHPGGDEVLIQSTGKDATAEFEDVGHSNDAEEKMKEFYVGDIDKSTLPEKHRSGPSPLNNNISNTTRATNNSSEDSSKLLLYILPLLVLGIAFILRFYAKQQ